MWVLQLDGSERFWGSRHLTWGLGSGQCIEITAWETRIAPVEILVTPCSTTKRSRPMFLAYDGTQPVFLTGFIPKAHYIISMSRPILYVSKVAASFQICGTKCGTKTPDLRGHLGFLQDTKITNHNYSTATDILLKCFLVIACNHS